MSRATRALAPVVVIGAGPHGLSTAVHLKGRGLKVRAFGPPKVDWDRNMPKGMLPKSSPSTSVLVQGRTYTLCTEHVLAAAVCPRLDAGFGISVPGLYYTRSQTEALAAREGRNR
ncbi:MULTISPECIES: hypothetical protein [unclassified Streptomyces]|uniref:FAD-dependent oxidoreductase n=1 Tax=unclassified Streptomyces TaxID=2593676 RepID=UPI002E806E24|nr:hypothetical protein [Streptomyces sp. NBC_00589]